jgi:hypothetical protein
MIRDTGAAWLLGMHILYMDEWLWARYYGWCDQRLWKDYEKLTA